MIFKESDPFLLVLKNQKSSKYFIIIDDDLPSFKVRVVNPSGDIINLPKTLFHPEIIEIDSSKFLKNLNEKQIDAYTHYQDRQKLLASSNRTTSRHQIKKKSSKQYRSKNPRETGGIRTTWKSLKLTFYKHKIAPLKSKDRFIILTEEKGKLIMSRSEFEQTFSEVLLAKEYRIDGFFSYHTFPEKAKKFLKP